ncbi:3-dehydroquinate synthase [Kiloniella sp. b19]|uniref:3-dehydroquinate synthase n=1 Tax=Kiloniella sp. GXU_MW_B19 TaxID=3141326 RepID=UPI0031DF3AEE
MSSASGTPRSLRVELGERSYDILIGKGLIEQSGTLIKPFLNQDRVFVVTDENVASLHLDALRKSLEAQGLQVLSITLPFGESTKSFAQLERIIDWLLEHRVDRKSTLLAFGGGVIGDLAGFAAASVMRGIDFIQIPTTLLSQVDSSVGGKTGINTPRGKNLVGAFHQPRLVLADTTVLQTLPRRELLAGYAEVAKYGLIRDAAFFSWLEDHATALLDGDEEALSEAILESCKAKARIVAEDERESGARGLLNLGHTFGHALEAEAGYNGTLLHGEAVSIGMVMAFDFSAQKGQIPQEDARRVRQHLEDLGLPVETGFVARQALGNKPLQPERLLDHMSRDKKVSNGQMTFVLLNALGEAYLDRSVDSTDLENFLIEACR